MKNFSLTFAALVVALAFLLPSASTTVRAAAEPTSAAQPAPALDVLPPCPRPQVGPTLPQCSGVWDLQCVAAAEAGYWADYAVWVDPIEDEYCGVRTQAENAKADMQAVGALYRDARDRCIHGDDDACAEAEALLEEYEELKAEYLAFRATALNLLQGMENMRDAAQLGFEIAVDACCDD